MSLVQLGRLGAVVAVALIGVLIGRASISVAERPERPLGESPAATQREAAVAAIEYLEALRWDVLVDDAARRQAITQRATSEAAPKLEAELVPAAAALRRAVKRPPVVARTAVLGFRVLRATDRRAVVRVWGMALFGSRAYPPTTQWSTSELTLVWTRDRWLVDAVESRGGPSPSAGVQALARRARGLEEVRHVP